MNFIWFLILFLALASCSTQEVKTESNSFQEVETIKWTAEMLRGYHYQLEGRKGLLLLSFPDRGKYVVATIGDLDGAIAGPVFRWRITAEGNLVIKDETTEQQLNLVKFTDEFVDVRIGTKAARYERSKAEDESHSALDNS